MSLEIDERASDMPQVQTIWRTQSAAEESFTSVAVSRWELVVMRQRGVTTIGLRGPETKASAAPIPTEAEFFGISFEHGAFMPQLSPGPLVDGGIVLPTPGPRTFWLEGRAWEIPTFENADTFVRRLVRAGVLVTDRLVVDLLGGDDARALSERTLRRRCLRATGLTPGLIRQIDKARRATAMLQRGVAILDVVNDAGYSDQPHLTHSLRRFVGHTPGALRDEQPAMSVSYKTREFAAK